MSGVVDVDVGLGCDSYLLRLPWCLVVVRLSSEPVTAVWKWIFFATPSTVFLALLLLSRSAADFRNFIARLCRLVNLLH